MTLDTTRFTFRLRGALAALFAAAALLAGCGDGSGRQGTDVQVTGSVPSEPVAGGQDVVFTMTVANVGSYTASDITIVSVVGNLKSITCEAFDGASCPPESALGPSMTVASMPAGSRLVFNVTVTVPRGANGAIFNTMTASIDNDTDRGNNSFTAQGTALSLVSEVVLEVTSSPTSATGGGTADFVYTLRNDGPDAATDLTVVNTVGSNLALSNIACAAGGGATCPTTSAVMQIPTLPVGGSLVFTVTTQVVQAINGTVTNTMAVAADSDSDRTNNTAVGSTAVVTPVSGLALSGTGPSNVPAGTAATFRMTLVNTGPDPAAGVRIVDQLGGNLTLNGVVCTASGGAVCPATLGPLMDVVDFPVNGTLVFDITATIANGTNGTIINTMTATATDGPRQEVVGVATGTAFANNLNVTGTPPVGPVRGGTTASFSMEVRNDGASGAFNAAIAVTYSPGLTAASPITCAATGGAVCPATLGATMTAPEIPTGGALTFSVPANVDSGFDGVVGVTVQATAAGDSFLGDNGDTASVRALP
jgi:uncharacterized repeat protein (TIGR01451 family)